MKHLHTSYHQRASSLVLVLVVIMVLALTGAYLVKQSQNKVAESNAEKDRKHLRIQAMNTLEVFKTQLYKVLQPEIGGVRSGVLFNTGTSLGGIIVDNILKGIPEHQFARVRLSCNEQGTPPRVEPCTTSAAAKDMPKRINVEISRRSDDGESIINLHATLSVQPSQLKSYSYLVTDETADDVKFGSGIYQANVGVFFRPRSTSPQPVVAFLNTGNLEFNGLFISNVTESDIRYADSSAYAGLGIPRGPAPQMSNGAYLSKTAASPLAELATNFQTLTSKAIKYDSGPNETLLDATVYYGTESDPCELKVVQKVQVPGTIDQCADFSIVNPLEEKKQAPRLPEKVPLLKKLFVSFMRVVGIDEACAIGMTGNITSGNQFSFSNCYVTTERVVYQGRPSDYDGKVIYLKSTYPTYINSKSSETKGSVCGRSTIISSSKIEFRKSVVRASTTGGTPADTEAHSALVALTGDAGVISPDTIALDGNPFSSRKSSGTSTSADVSFRNETALVSIQGASLVVHPNFLSNSYQASDHGLGTLAQVGAVIAAYGKPTRSIFSSSGTSTYRGFYNVDSRFIPASASNPAPGFTSNVSSTFDITVLGISFSETNLAEALKSIN